MRTQCAFVVLQPGLVPGLQALQQVVSFGVGLAAGQPLQFLGDQHRGQAQRAQAQQAGHFGVGQHHAAVGGFGRARILRTGRAVQPDARAGAFAHHVHRVGVVEGERAYAKQVGQGVARQVFLDEVNPQRRAAIAFAFFAHPLCAHRHVGVHQQFQARLAVGVAAVGKPVQARMRGVYRRHIRVLHRVQVQHARRHFALQPRHRRVQQAPGGFPFAAGHAVGRHKAAGIGLQVVVHVLAAPGFGPGHHRVANGVGVCAVAALGLAGLGGLGFGFFGCRLDCRHRGAGHRRGCRSNCGWLGFGRRCGWGCRRQRWRGWLRWGRSRSHQGDRRRAAGRYTRCVGLHAAQQTQLRGRWAGFAVHL